MAVHVPILADGGKLYSYWLSYRGTGNDGLAAGGLSVHLSWFSMCDGIFGSGYDSLNYDAFGDTADDTSDSFVVPGTCYVVAPAALMMDIDYGAVQKVQPIVCIDRLRIGKDITISVSFLDPKSPPTSNKVELESDLNMGCSRGTKDSGELELDMSSGKNHLLRYIGTGIGGAIEVTSLCLESDSHVDVTAYFYDTYPYAHMALGSPPGYGAYRSLKVSSSSSCSGNGGTIDYLSEYGETYVLLKPSKHVSGATVYYRSTCTVDKCHGSQYMAVDGTCQQCPAGSVAKVGSTSISDCTSCTNFGAVAPHDRATECSFLNDYDPFLTTGTGWRLFTHSSNIAEGWKWDVSFIEFFSSVDCSPDSVIDVSSGDAIDSGNAGKRGYGPSNAFQNSDYAWGGRAAKLGGFWIGMEFDDDVVVRCVKLNQPNSDSFASQLLIQVKQEGIWSNVWPAKNLVDGSNTIQIVPTQSPGSPDSGCVECVQSLTAPQKVYKKACKKLKKTGEKARAKACTKMGKLVFKKNWSPRDACVKYDQCTV